MVCNKKPDAGRRGIVTTRCLKPKNDLKSEGNNLNVQNTCGIFCQPCAQYEELKRKYTQRTSRDSSRTILFVSLGYVRVRSGAAVLSTLRVASVES